MFVGNRVERMRRGTHGRMTSSISPFALEMMCCTSSNVFPESEIPFHSRTWSPEQPTRWHNKDKVFNYGRTQETRTFAKFSVQLVSHATRVDGGNVRTNLVRPRNDLPSYDFHPCSVACKYTSEFVDLARSYIVSRDMFVT